MNFDWEQEKRRMTAHRQEILEFREAFETTDVAARHDDLVSQREAEFAERMDGFGAAQVRLAAEIQAGAPGLPLAAAHRLAAKRLGRFQ